MLIGFIYFIKKHRFLAELVNEISIFLYTKLDFICINKIVFNQLFAKKKTSGEIRNPKKIAFYNTMIGCLASYFLLTQMILGQRLKLGPAKP